MNANWQGKPYRFYLPALFWGVTVAAAITSFIGSGFINFWAPLSWQVLAASVRESSFVLALIGAIVVAFSAPLVQSNMVVMGANAARAPTQIFVLHMGRVLAPLYLGWLLGYLPLLLRILFNRPADFSASVLIVFPTTFVAVASLVFLAYYVAVLTPGKFGILTSLASVIIAVQIPLSISDFMVEHEQIARLLPIGSYIKGNALAHNGYATTVSLQLLRTGLFVLVFLAIWVAWSAYIDKRQKGIYRLTLLTPFLILIPGMIFTPTMEIVIDQPNHCSETKTGSKICTYQVLTPLHETIAQQLQLASELTGINPKTVTASQNEGNNQSIMLSSPWGQKESDYLHDLQQEIGYYYVGIRACDTHGGNDRADIINNTVATVILARLSGNERDLEQVLNVDTLHDDYSPEAKQLFRLSPEQFRSWYQKHYEKARSCKLTDKDLPK